MRLRTMLLLIGFALFQSSLAFGTGNQASAASQQANELQKTIERLEASNNDSVQTMKAIYELSIESHDRAISRITWLASAIAGIMTVGAAFLAWFGIKEVGHITRIRKKFEEDYSNFGADNLRTDLMNIFKAEFAIRNAMGHIDRHAFTSAIDLINEALQLNPKDVRVLALGFANKAYCLKRLDRFDEALASAREASGICQENRNYCYNVACYAAILYGKTSSNHYLTLALQSLKRSLPDYAEDAKRDGDLDPIKSSPEFSRMLTPA